MIDRYARPMTDQEINDALLYVGSAILSTSIALTALATTLQDHNTFGLGRIIFAIAMGGQTDTSLGDHSYTGRLPCIANILF